MESREYTAQEMREEAKQCKRLGYYVAEAMLRQAADTEEELAQLKESKDRWMQYQETAAGERNACIDELRKKDEEIAQLKARMEAVEYACEQAKKLVSQISMPLKRENGWCSTDPMTATGLNAIFSAIRGE